ncbi:hypothetical protein M1293_02000 [Candidatus Parvarchaeota archaeon]|nr:hypothetical protein [Candidatus Parvarchaeota archaeon]
MEEKIAKKMAEKINNKEVFIGMNSTVRAYKNGQLDFIVYSKNISENMLSRLEKLGAPLHKYDGDSESMSIACGKKFNVAVIGIKK